MLYYVIIALSFLVPITFSTLLAYNKTAELNSSPQLPHLRAGLIWVVQIDLMITLITVIYLVDGIIRIFKAVKNNKRLVMDESYMLYHVLAYSIYSINLFVFDVLYIRNS